MRTNLILTTAAFGVASSLGAMAQVYSVNAVGYINVTVKGGGYAMVANQLKVGGNTIAEVLPNVPEGTIVSKYSQGAGFSVNQFNFGAWDRPTEVLNQGEAFFIRNPNTTDTQVTFVGEVPQGTLNTTLAVGLNLVSSQVPQAGKLVTDLGFPPDEGDIIYQWDGAAQTYKAPNQFNFGAWDNGEPTVAVGEGFFAQKAAAKTWTRTFSVNPP